MPGHRPLLLVVLTKSNGRCRAGCCRWRGTLPERQLWSPARDGTRPVAVIRNFDVSTAGIRVEPSSDVEAALAAKRGVSSQGLGPNAYGTGLAAPKN